MRNKIIQMIKISSALIGPSLSYSAYCTNIYSLGVSDGLRTISHNELLGPDVGTANELGLNFGLIENDYFGLRLGYNRGSFKVKNSDSDSSSQIQGKLNYSNYLGALFLNLPLGPLQFFLELGVSYGSADLNYLSTSESEIVGGSHISSQVNFDSDFSTQGAYHRIGLRLGRTYGLLVSLENSYESWLVKSVNYSVASQIDGDTEPIDTKDPNLETSFSGIVGQHLGHLSKCILIALDVRY